MKPPAFLTSSPVKLRFSSRSAPSRLFVTPTRIPHKPSHNQTKCGLSKDLATAAAAAVTLSLSILPVRPNLTHAIPHAYPHHPQQASLTINTAHTHSQRVSTPLVVGVGKAAIHDYAPYADTHPEPQPPEQPVTHVTIARSIEQHPQQIDDETRREFSLAVRLVTAVLLGVMLGVERRATSFNLGVRSITLISICTAMASLMATGAESGLYVPLMTMAPHMTILSVAAATGLAVYIAARLRQRRTRHIAAMSWTIALSVAMGGACGAGLSLLTVSSYLAAVAVMRSDGPRKRPDSGQRVKDSSVVRSEGKETWRVGRDMGRMPLDPLINLRHGEGMDGHGLST